MCSSGIAWVQAGGADYLEDTSSVCVCVGEGCESTRARERELATERERERKRGGERGKFVSINGV